MNEACNILSNTKRDWSDRVATVAAKLDESDREELEYISAALGMEHAGKTDVELRDSLVGLMSHETV